MSFLLFKFIHVACVALSFSLFFLRGIWSMNESPVMQQRWIKIVPHIVDTLLLVSAILLAYTIDQYPFAERWLSAKLAALMLYIVLGSIALKSGCKKSTRLYVGFFALGVFCYIVLVAISHNPSIYG
jgi:uncharacterized membrane protein SirB2